MRVQVRSVSCSGMTVAVKRAAEASVRVYGTNGHIKTQLISTYLKSIHSFPIYLSGTSKGGGGGGKDRENLDP